MTGRVSTILGRDVEFFETGVARRADVTLDADWRLADQLRVTTATRTVIDLARARIPKVRLEAAIDSAFGTWENEKCLKKLDLIKRADDGSDPDIFDFFFSWPPSTVTTRRLAPALRAKPSAAC